MIQETMSPIVSTSSSSSSGGNCIDESFLVPSKFACEEDSEGQQNQYSAKRRSDVTVDTEDCNNSCSSTTCNHDDDNDLRYNDDCSFGTDQATKPQRSQQQVQPKMKRIPKRYN